MKAMHADPEFAAKNRERMKAIWAAAKSVIKNDTT